jgi:Ser/Thr protein kinase RdoA (MazF antagonist)
LDFDVLEFDELTKKGRSARLRRFVPDLLAREYGLTCEKVTLLSAHSVNTLFRCETVDELALVLRIGPPQPIHTPGSEALESVMLSSIAEMTKLPVARMIPSAEGSLTTSLTGEHINGPRNCSLLSFVPGKAIDPPSVEAAQSLGNLHATMHSTMDETFSAVYLLSDASFELRPTLFFHNRNTLYTHESDHGSLFREAIDRVQRVTDHLWRDAPHPPYAMHGDFGMHNLLKSRAQYIPIDFQDCFVGFDIQDIGITLADFRRPALAPFRDAYVGGYAERRPFPEMSPDLLDSFAAQRILNVMNLELNLKPHGFVGYIERNVAAIKDWMDSPS